LRHAETPCGNESGSPQQAFIPKNAHHWSLVSFQQALHTIAPESVDGHEGLDSGVILVLVNGFIEDLFFHQLTDETPHDSV
jgi:hypothetical protein